MAFVREHDPVEVILRSSDLQECEPVLDPTTETSVMTLWNRDLLDCLTRKKVSRPGGNDYYRVDDSLPTLEFSPSRLVTWNGRPALLQGRVYGFFDKSSPGYERWYKAITHWLRGNFVRNPLSLVGGYIGPAAFKWFQEGGALLPMFEPALTMEWLSFVENQHSNRASPDTTR